MSRRKLPRLIGHFSGSWQDPGGGAVAAHITNITGEGCFIQAPRTPEVGKTVGVTVTIPEVEPRPLPAKVVRVQWGFGFAVEFTPKTDADRATLAAVVKRLGARPAVYHLEPGRE